MPDDKPATERDTPDMLAVPGNERFGEHLKAGSFNNDMAAEAGQRALDGLSQVMGVPKLTDLCVIQWGREATRPGEPAHITGKFTSSHPHAKGRPGFFAVVQFEDGAPDWVDMQWNVYPREEKPPWWLSHKRTIPVTEDGETRDRLLQVDRPEDRAGWLEFIASKHCRRSLTVIEEADRHVN